MFVLGPVLLVLLGNGLCMRWPLLALSVWCVSPSRGWLPRSWDCVKVSGVCRDGMGLPRWLSGFSCCPWPRLEERPLVEENAGEDAEERGRSGMGTCVSDAAGSRECVAAGVPSGSACMLTYARSSWWGLRGLWCWCWWWSSSR